MSLPVAARRTREAQVVAAHDAAMRAAGAGSDRDAWHDYRLGLAVRAVTIVSLVRSPAMLAGGFGPVVSRCLVAAADHAVEELVEALVSA